MMLIGNSVCLGIGYYDVTTCVSPFSPFHHLCVVRFDFKNNAYHKYEEGERERESNSTRIVQRYLNRIDIRHF